MDNFSPAYSLISYQKISQILHGIQEKYSGDFSIESYQRDNKRIQRTIEKLLQLEKDSLKELMQAFRYKAYGLIMGLDGYVAEKKIKQIRKKIIGATGKPDWIKIPNLDDPEIVAYACANPLDYLSFYLCFWLELYLQTSKNIFEPAFLGAATQDKFLHYLTEVIWLLANAHRIRNSYPTLWKDKNKLTQFADGLFHEFIELKKQSWLDEHKTIELCIPCGSEEHATYLILSYHIKANKIYFRLDDSEISKPELLTCISLDNELQVNNAVEFLTAIFLAKNNADYNIAREEIINERDILKLPKVHESENDYPEHKTQRVANCVAEGLFIQQKYRMQEYFGRRLGCEIFNSIHKNLKDYTNDAHTQPGIFTRAIEYSDTFTPHDAMLLSSFKQSLIAKYQAECSQIFSFNNKKKLSVADDYIDLDIKNKDLKQQEGILEQLFTSSSSKQRIWIYGDAGTGKTTFINKAIWQWAITKENTRFKLILLLPLKKLNKLNYNTNHVKLKDIISREFSSVFSNEEFSEAELINYINKYKDQVLFVLESFDQFSEEISPAKDFIDKLLTSSDYHILVTSRDAPGEDLQGYIQYQIQGFDYENIGKFIVKYIGIAKTKDLYLFLSKHSELYSLATNPLNLAIICTCWESLNRLGSEKITQTMLYCALARELWIHYLDRQEVKDRLTPQSFITLSKALAKKDASIKQIDLIIDELIRSEKLILAEVAYYGLKKHQLELQSSLFFDLGCKSELFTDNDKISIPFFECAKYTGFITTDETENCTFIHQTFQEFFAAIYWVSCFKSEHAHLKQQAVDYFKTYRYDSFFKHVWNFVAGLIRPDLANEFFKLFSIEDVSYLQNAPYTHLVLSCFNEAKMSLTINSINAFSVYIEGIIKDSAKLKESVGQKFWQIINCYPQVKTHTNFVNAFIAILKLPLDIDRERRLEHKVSILKVLVNFSMQVDSLDKAILQLIKEPHIFSEEVVCRAYRFLFFHRYQLTTTHQQALIWLEENFSILRLIHVLEINSPESLAKFPNNVLNLYKLIIQEYEANQNKNTEIIDFKTLQKIENVIVNHIDTTDEFADFLLKHISVPYAFSLIEDLVPNKPSITLKLKNIVIENKLEYKLSALFALYSSDLADDREFVFNHLLNLIQDTENFDYPMRLLAADALASNKWDLSNDNCKRLANYVTNHITNHDSLRELILLCLSNNKVALLAFLKHFIKEWHQDKKRYKRLIKFMEYINKDNHTLAQEIIDDLMHDKGNPIIISFVEIINKIIWPFSQLSRFYEELEIEESYLSSQINFKQLRKNNYFKDYFLTKPRMYTYKILRLAFTDNIAPKQLGRLAKWLMNMSKINSFIAKEHVAWLKQSFADAVEEIRICISAMRNDFYLIEANEDFIEASIIALTDSSYTVRNYARKYLSKFSLADHLPLFKFDDPLLRSGEGNIFNSTNIQEVLAKYILFEDEVYLQAISYIAQEDDISFCYCDNRLFLVAQKWYFVHIDEAKLSVLISRLNTKITSEEELPFNDLVDISSLINNLIFLEKVKKGIITPEEQLTLQNINSLIEQNLEQVQVHYPQFSLCATEANLYLQLAEYYYKEKKYQQSADYFDKYFLTQPNDVNAYEQASSAYYKVGKLEKAATTLQKLVTTIKDASPYYHNLAWCYFVRAYEDYSQTKVLNETLIAESDTYFRRAIQVRPTCALYIAFAIFLLKQDKMQEAKDHLLQALKLASNDLDACKEANTYIQIEQIVLPRILQNFDYQADQITLPSYLTAYLLLLTEIPNDCFNQDRILEVFSQELYANPNEQMREIYRENFTTKPQIKPSDEKIQESYPQTNPVNDSTIKNDQLLEQVMKSSLEAAQTQGKIGPRIINGWDLYDVDDDGNCFYRAVGDQLELLNHSFIMHVTQESSLHNSLRLHIQGKAFQDKEWAGDKEIQQLCKKLNVIVAVIDTRFPENKYTYYYMDEDDEEKIVFDNNDIPQKPIIKLAYTGNHYLSIRAEANMQALAQYDQTSPAVYQSGENSLYTLFTGDSKKRPNETRYAKNSLEQSNNATELMLQYSKKIKIMQAELSNIILAIENGKYQLTSNLENEIEKLQGCIKKLKKQKEMAFMQVNSQLIEFQNVAQNYSNDKKPESDDDDQSSFSYSFSQ